MWLAGKAQRSRTGVSEVNGGAVGLRLGLARVACIIVYVCDMWCRRCLVERGWAVLHVGYERSRGGDAFDIRADVGGGQLHSCASADGRWRWRLLMCCWGTRLRHAGAAAIRLNRCLRWRCDCGRIWASAAADASAYMRGRHARPCVGIPLLRARVRVLFFTVVNGRGAFSAGRCARRAPLRL